MTRLTAVDVGATPASWAALGFAIDNGVVALGNGSIRPVDGRSGLSAIAVTGIEAAISVDGLPITPGDEAPNVEHPNGARSIDHVVVMTDSLDRTSAAIEASLGLERRRLRETDTVRQAFHRFADPAEWSATGERGCILELVENPRVPRPEFWGLVVIVDDLDALCDAHPDLVAPPKPAVQPGRRIATVHRDADLGTAVAFMTPAR